MRVEMIPLLPQGAIEEVIVDRRTESALTVLVEPFSLGSTAITRAQWAQLHGLEVDPAVGHLPKTDVTWREAVLFCNSLSESEGLDTAYTISHREIPAPSPWRAHSEPEPDDWLVSWNREADGYRLPTDAEWQAACRAGTSGARYGLLDDIAWFADNSDDRVHHVGTKAPNAWGLYDMLGNVWEWCWDQFDPDVYGSYRIIRGGGWSDQQWSCRAGVRRKTNPQAKFDDLGFRVARSCFRDPS